MIRPTLHATNLRSARGRLFKWFKHLSS